MSMLARQISEVLEVYASRRSTLLLGGLAAIVILGQLWFAALESAPPDQGMPSVLLGGYIRCMLFSWLMSGQLVSQFAHPRARLMPNFARTHVAIPATIAVLLGIVVPAAIAALQHTSILELTAVNSAMVGYYVAAVGGASAVLALVIALPLFTTWAVGFDLWEAQLNLSAPMSVAILATSWTAMAYYLWRLPHTHEEDPAYERLQAKAIRSEGRRGGQYDQTWFPHRWAKSPRRWRVADLWNDRIGGYHQGGSLRVVRLLQHGFGRQSPELDALSWFAGLLFLSLWMFVDSAEQAHEVIDPLMTGRLTPALIVVFVPAAMALDPLGRRSRLLAGEIFLPLSRKRLIDSLIRGAAWRMGLLWLAGNAVAVVLLWTAPGLTPSVWRLVTYLFLSAVVTLSTFGCVLVTVLWVELVARVAAMLAFVAMGLALVLLWWFNRDALSDVPFWIAGCVMLAFGRAMYRSGRRDWLNLELGGKIPD